MIQDYRPLEQLDRYKVDEDADNDAVEEVSFAACHRAERELGEMDRLANHVRSFRDGGRVQLNNDDSDEEEEGAVGFFRRGGRTARREGTFARHRDRAIDSMVGSIATPVMSKIDGSGTPALSQGVDPNNVDGGGEPFELNAQEIDGQPMTIILSEKLLNARSSLA